MKYLYILAAVAATVLLGTLTQYAAAASDRSGFGEAASTIGKDGLMGCHSSSFDTPRAGIGNVAASFDLTVWGLGAFLLSVILGGAPVPGC